MISTIKDNDDKIIAYIEWQILDEKAQFKDFGEYIYIQDLWIHQDYRHNGYLKKLIYLIDSHDFAKNGKYVYWERHKYNDRQSKIYNRNEIAKQGAYHGF